MGDWHYTRGDQQYGPKNVDVIQKLIEAGIISPQTLVWREGLSDWVSAEQAGLFAGKSAGQPLPPQLPATQSSLPSSSSSSASVTPPSTQQQTPQSALTQTNASGMSRSVWAVVATAAWLFFGVLIGSLLTIKLGVERYTFGLKILVWLPPTLLYLLVIANLFLKDHVERLVRAAKRASPVRFVIASVLFLAALLLHVTILDWDFGSLEYGPAFNLDSRKVIGISVPISEYGPGNTRFYGVVIPGPLIHRGSDICLGLVLPLVFVIASPFVIFLKT